MISSKNTLAEKDDLSNELKVFHAKTKKSINIIRIRRKDQFV